MVSSSILDTAETHLPSPTVENLRMALSAYAEESGAPFQNLRQGLRDLVRQIASDAPPLEQELKNIQQRLGTPCERPDDMNRCAVIAHLLTNLMCMALLVQGMDKA